jgi:hypothetical protein
MEAAIGGGHSRQLCRKNLCCAFSLFCTLESSLYTMWDWKSRPEDIQLSLILVRCTNPWTVCLLFQQTKAEKFQCKQKIRSVASLK